MKINVITLGCPKNTVDSEILRAQLNADEVCFTENPEGADAVIINTCAFILPAREEAIETIFDAVNLKNSGKIKHIFVTGCLPQMSTEELVKEIPEVDGFFPEKDFLVVGKKIADTLKIDSSGKKLLRNLETPSHYAYLKISEGCDNRCRYCTIPLIKGNHRSKPMEYLLQEAKELAELGTKELIVVAQDTTYYGRDWGEKNGLVKLLHELEKIEGLRWIRLLYAHPAHITDELIDFFAASEKLCRYIDLPIQHISDKILKAMGRPSDSGQIKRVIEKLRERIPEICIRTTVMVGYPGETDEDFHELKAFVEQIKFGRLGVFKFIPEPDTPAYHMKDQIDESVKEDRLQEIMELQAKISYDKNRQLIGRRIPVIIDDKNEAENSFLGRTEWDSPEIDNLVHVKGQAGSGEITNVLIEDVDSYDLWGKII